MSYLRWQNKEHNMWYFTYTWVTESDVFQRVTIHLVKIAQLSFRLFSEKYWKIYVLTSIFLDLEEKIGRVVHENPNSHFFMDEVPLGFGISAEELADVSEKIPQDNCLWSACQSQLHPSSDDLRDCGKLFYLTSKFKELSHLFF